ncbi:MAG: 2-C-methyl-D-erythritol 2,4-cyclodiphosphate synthase [Spirochaetaceae bacterium]|nr:MAG: 2-C-methyl-D-erythritol 2,4-cyclodiphosphate synthase [Spirochaetaceae bacterium]
MRIGQGYDIHRLVENRALVLGGAVIPHNKGEHGHSDGDVLIHAVIDALLGAAALGDIGTHFPPSDPAFKNIKSTILLEKTMQLIREAGYTVANIDTTIILETPVLKPHIPVIRTTIAKFMDLPEKLVSVKAKTKEGLDSTGTGNAVEAHAVVLLEEAVI